MLWAEQALYMFLLLVSLVCHSIIATYTNIQLTWCDVFAIAQDIVVSFANLNFITDHLGLANDFQAYQNTLAAAVTFLKTDDQVRVLNNLMRDSFREYCKRLSYLDGLH